jgi:uncharacterized spore protein YtfJ
MEFDDSPLKGAYDAMTVQRVYGDPIEQGGVIVVPAASVRGGGGFGGGADATGSEGGGGGSGVTARPVGVYRIEDGDVTWIPAVDATRIAMVGQFVGVVFLLVLRSVLKKRRKR